MNTHFNLLLDTRRKRKDNTFPIIFRLIHLGKSTSIATGYYVEKRYWDTAKKEVKNSYPDTFSVARLNTVLLKERARANDILNKLADQRKLRFLSLKELRDKITTKAVYDSFFDFGEQLVEELKALDRVGTAKSYQVTLSVLKGFTNGVDLKFNEVNLDLLERFHKYHMDKKGNSLNGLSCYMRNIRALFNRGIKAGIIEHEAYPFIHYQIKTEPTAKRALDITGIRKIVNLELSKSDPLYNYRNYFLISYMLYGIPFIDLAFLKLRDIQDGRLKYKRKKTAKQYNIKLTDQVVELLSNYTEGKGPDDFIFPFIHRKSLDHQYKDLHRARRLYNLGLREIAKKCQIQQQLTAYVARHSFATQAMLQDVPLQAISEMLGHTSLTTTQIYLKSLPSNILDDYNEKIVMI
jgi:site-specific recombinase XerD